MKKKYYIRYYASEYCNSTLQNFINAIASVHCIELHSIVPIQMSQRTLVAIEYVLIFTVNVEDDYIDLENDISKALESM